MSLSPPHIEDSLDNLSNMKDNKYRQLLAQVKQSFAGNLTKLQSAQTRQIGILELRKLIEGHREVEHLRNYIAILKNLKNNSNSTTKEHQILVISIIAQTYKDKLLDPLDKPPSLLKSAFRLVELVHTYLNDHSPTVQQACARALLDLTSYCLQGQSCDTVFSIIYSPLISILKSGVDKSSQATAAACLNELIMYNRKVQNHELLAKLAPEMLAVILKVNCEYHELFQAIGSMLQTRELSFLQGRVFTFLGKILPVICGTRDAANSSNFNSYMCKVGVCKIIEKLGQLLSLQEKEKLSDLNVVEALQQASRHRIIQVQLAATRAYKSWKGEKVESPAKGGLTSLEEKRNSKKKQRSKSREDRDKMENQLTFMKQDLQKLVKGGWGANNRAKNYIKRGTGVGGGQHGKMEVSPQSRSGSKSHKEHFEQLKDFIRKGARQNKNLDRFANGGRDEKRSQSPPPRSNSPIVRRKLSNKKVENDDDQIQLEMDEGDQMIYDNKQKKRQPIGDSSRPRNVLQEMGISEDQARELQAHQTTLMQEGRGMNIKFNTANSQKSRKAESVNNQQKGRANRLVDSKAESQASRTQMEKQFKIPLSENSYKSQHKKQQTPNHPWQIPTADFNTKATKKQPNDFPRLSQQQIGQLVEQFNLSQVSENLNDILNESDLHMLQSSKMPMMDSGIMQPSKGFTQKDAIKEAVQEKKTRHSVINKFFKRDVSEVKPLEDSSIVKEPMIQPATNQLVPLVVNEQNNNHSLNFTESGQSRSRSPIKTDEIQFTLNPKDKFTTLKEEPVASKNQQIQQDIAMSCYEESVPKGEQLIYKPKQQSQPQKKSPLQQQQVKRDTSPQQKADYQKLIKNPPRILIQQRYSVRQTQKSEPSHSQISKEQQLSPDMKLQWLRILDLLNHGEVNSAFEETIAIDDPIYLLRLMLITKTPLKKLTAATTQKLWSKFMSIFSHRFIDVLAVSLFSQANDLALLPNCLSIEQLQQVLLGLYELSGTSKGKLSYKAAQLYNDIQTSIHPQ